MRKLKFDNRRLITPIPDEREKAVAEAQAEHQAETSKPISQRSP